MKIRSFLKGARSRGEALCRGAWFFAFTSLAAALVSLNYFRQFDIDFSGEGGVYAFCTMFGHFAMLGALAWLVCCLPWALAFPKRIVAPVISGIAGTLGLSVVVLDTFVFGLYRYHVYNGFVLDLLLGDGAAGIFVFTPGQIALMAGGILSVAAVIFGCLLAAHFVAEHTRGKALGAVAGTLALLLAASHLMHAYYSANGSRSVYRIAEVYPGYFPLTANRLLIRTGLVDAEKVREKIKLNAGTALDYPRSPLVPAKAPTKNLLVIFVDSWNFRAFTPEVMPNAWKFAESAQVFTDHYSGDHGTRTGVLSFFHGIPGTYFNAIRDGGVSSAFVDVLLESGYETAIYATASLSNPPFTRTVFKNVPAESVRDNFSAGVSTAEGDERLAEAWLEFTRSRENVPETERKPFFGFLFFDELHAMTLPKNAEKNSRPTGKIRNTNASEKTPTRHRFSISTKTTRFGSTACSDAFLTTCGNAGCSKTPSSFSPATTGRNLTKTARTPGDTARRFRRISSKCRSCFSMRRSRRKRIRIGRRITTQA